MAFHALLIQTIDNTNISPYNMAVSVLCTGIGMAASYATPHHQHQQHHVSYNHVSSTNKYWKMYSNADEPWWLLNMACLTSENSEDDSLRATYIRLLIRGVTILCALYKLHGTGEYHAVDDRRCQRYITRLYIFRTGGKFVTKHKSIAQHQVAEFRVSFNSTRLPTATTSW